MNRYAFNTLMLITLALLVSLVLMASSAGGTATALSLTSTSFL